jgi:ferric-dicitrate binding protein FerR (iron transport regulator)
MNEEPSNEFSRLKSEAGRIAYLMSGYIRETLTEAEHRELDNWVTASMENQKLFEDLTDPETLKKWMREKEAAPQAEMLERIKKKMVFTEESPQRRTRQLWPWLVAAAVFAALFFRSHLLTRLERLKQVPELAKQTDIAPGGRHAYLTRSDGTTILLDTVKNGKISETLQKEDGLLEYQLQAGTGSTEAARSVNRIVTPAGGEFRVVLGDGTRVWLNAGTSLEYPVPFDGTREVTLSGEAYFEVAKDPMHPFVVASGNNRVEVLSTRFNVNAYANQKATVVTLAEGAVKVNQKTVLKPGEQARVLSGTGEVRTATVDLDPVLAWTRGRFLFSQTPLPEVMDQIAHWYDAKIVYQDNITEHFNASISRDSTVSKLLHLLEATGSVHFKIEDKTITVMK